MSHNEDSNSIDYSLKVTIFLAKPLQFQAYQYVEECLARKPRIDIRQYLNAQILDEICDKTEHPRITVQSNKAPADDSDTEVGVDFSHALRRRMNSTENQSDDEGF